MKTKLILVSIILLAFFLRFNKVTEVPPALNWDEVSIGYNAYSVLNSGKDEWGVFLPVHFKAYGEYKLPIQIYASIPGIAVFGLNPLGVRITPIVYGTLTVLLLFFLGRAIFQNSAIGLLSAFLLAISPWHIQLTRASFESSFSVFWVLMGIWFLVKGFSEKEWFIWSMVPFAISIFTYNSARIFTPLFLFAILIIYRKILFKYKKALLTSIVLFAVLLIPLTPFLLSGERSARYKLVSITDDPGLILRINENRGYSKLPQPLPRLVHNKITYVALYTTKNYLAHFTPGFLFLTGAPHKQHHVQDMGELYLFQLPLVLLGMRILFKRKQKYKGIILPWLLIAFIPASVTNDSIPHALRTAVAAPVYQLISANGAFEIYLWIKKKKWLNIGYLLTSVIIIISLALYLNNYYNIYPIKYSRDWQYGYKQVVDYIGKHKDEYDLIVFTRHYGEPHMFTLFYLNYPPDKYQNDLNLVRFETYDWIRVLRFDKFYFPDLGDKGTKFADIVKQNPGKKILFTGRAGDFPKEIPRLYSVNFLNGENAFDIVEVGYNQVLTVSTSQYESINPNLLVYPLKRIYEEIKLNLLPGKERKGEYLYQLFEVRFKELVYIVNNKKEGFIEFSADRYNSFVGRIKNQYPPDNGQRAKISGYLKMLEILRDKYHSNSLYWEKLQQTIDTTKSLI